MAQQKSSAHGQSYLEYSRPNQHGPLPITEKALLIHDLKHYGDCTSHFASTLDLFHSYHLPLEFEGQIRYAQTEKFLVAASEPLCQNEFRLQAFESFHSFCKKNKKELLSMPIGENLALELKRKKYHILPIGVEPVFELNQFFLGSDLSPLLTIPKARTLQRKGYYVEEVSPTKLTEGDKYIINQMYQNWLKRIKSVPLSFLNTTDLWELIDHKKIFFLKCPFKTHAVLFCTPIYGRKGVFFSDYFKTSDAKVGCMELLFLETMALLHQQKYEEVRLGLCPLQGINHAHPELRTAFWYPLLKMLGPQVRHPINFKSLFDFKMKFNPTRLDPLYLASSKRMGFDILKTIQKIHDPDLRLTGPHNPKILGTDVLTKYFKPERLIPSRPLNFTNIMTTLPFTFGLAVVMIFFHAGRIFVPAINELYLQHPFQAGNYSLLSHFLAPLFHNNWKHFLGDLSTFILSIGAMEWLAGRKKAMVITALGLWASNPLTWGLLFIFLKPLDPNSYESFLKEVDWGSSNSIYAAAGALATQVKKPSALLIPFALNGIFLFFNLNMWISLHHLVALSFGYLVAEAWWKSEQQKKFKV